MEFDATAMADRGEVTLRRVYDASPEELFSAMTDAAALERFWGPVGMTCPSERTIVERRVGGTFSTTMVNDESGEEHLFSGVFTRFDPPLTLGWIEPGIEMETTVTFRDLDGGRTEASIVQENVPLPFRSPEALAGFESSLQRLADHLADPR
ncbi:MAG: SRPBCC domain-containing protein [Actinomycetes bacterium]